MANVIIFTKIPELEGDVLAVKPLDKQKVKVTIKPLKKSVLDMRECTIDFTLDYIRDVDLISEYLNKTYLDKK